MYSDQEKLASKASRNFSNPSIVFQTKELSLGRIDVNIILLSLNPSILFHSLSVQLRLPLVGLHPHSVKWVFPCLNDDVAIKFVRTYQSS